MITVRREWLAKDGLLFEAIENAKDYRERFDPSGSWRVHNPNNGLVYTIIVYEDYESLAEAEAKWQERTSSPEFEGWHAEWRQVAVGNSLTFNYLGRH